MSASGRSVDSSGQLASATDGKVPVAQGSKVMYVDGGEVLADRFLQNVLYATPAAALQAAIDSLGGAGKVKLPKSTILIDATINRPSQVILVGGGWGTVLKATATLAALGAGTPILDTVRSGTLDYSGSDQGAVVRDLMIDGDSRNVTGLRSVNYVAGGLAESARASSMDNVKIRGCVGAGAVGLRLIQDQGFHARACSIHENTLGIYASDNAQLGSFEGCDIRGNVTGTLLEATGNIITDQTLDKPYGFKFTRTHWESNTGKGLVLDGATYNTFDTCKWENNAGTAVEITDTNSGLRPDGNVFINPIMNGCVAAPTAKLIDLVKGVGTVFFGGHLNSGNNSGVFISANAFLTQFFGTTIDATVTDSNTQTKYFTPNGGTAKNILPTPDVQIFTANGTWTKPNGATMVQVSAIAAGGGGGAGRRSASGVVASGGGGGGGGGFSQSMFSAAALGSTEAVVVASAGGAGAAAQTADSTDGAAGTSGGVSTFGTKLRATSGTGGNGGTTAGAAAASGGTAMVNGGQGVASSTTGLAGTAAGNGTGGAPGGGSGGGVTTAPAANIGGAGGGTLPNNNAGGGTAGNGAAGGNGTSATATLPLPGGGGGGGGGNAAGAAYAGGNGGNYGGGGGGGGGSLNGNASGAGGNGGPGILVVVSF